MSVWDDIGAYVPWVGALNNLGKGQGLGGALKGGTDAFGNIGKFFGMGTDEIQPRHQIDPNAGAFDPSQSNETRMQQQALIQALQDQAAGKGPSLAQDQLRQGTEAGLKQAMALGAAQQGQGLGYQSALRGIADQQAAARQQGAGQSAQLRMMEQLQAQQQLAQLLGGTRGQDLGQAQGQSNAGLQMEGMQANQGLAYDQLQHAKDREAYKTRLGFAKGIGEATGVPFAYGGEVDSPANDTVPAMLSPGEIVLPRSVTQAEDAPAKARAFVEAIRMAKRSKVAA